MKILLALVLLTSLNNAFAQVKDHEEVFQFPQVDNLWLRAAPPTAKMLAAYVTIDNQTDNDLTLVGAYAPDFGMAEIHKTIEVDGMLKMREQKTLELPQQTKITMQPGGLHIMLMMPEKSFKEGDEARICLVYKDEFGAVHVQHIDFPVLKK